MPNVRMPCHYPSNLLPTTCHTQSSKVHNGILITCFRAHLPRRQEPSNMPRHIIISMPNHSPSGLTLSFCKRNRLPNHPFRPHHVPMPRRTCGSLTSSDN
eukprot:GDKK01072309.1.p3 GENE.GDKK01072309.1~~GDKK01072309.1.p3  ORF type:complete len:100 (+),score=3.88 GDKK01072309.1:123-422(+)